MGSLMTVLAMPYLPVEQRIKESRASRVELVPGQPSRVDRGEDSTRRVDAAVDARKDVADRVEETNLSGPALVPGPTRDQVVLAVDELDVVRDELEHADRPEGVLPGRVVLGSDLEVDVVGTAEG